MNRLSIPIATLAAAAIVLTSCGTSGDGGGNLAASESGGGGLAPLSQRLTEEQGYMRDADGNWVPRSNRRSQFENRTASGTARNNPFGDRRFRANGFQTAEWTRNRSAAPEPYTGNTDGSRFQTTAAAQGQAHRQASDRANTPGPYQTPRFGTSASREDGARRLGRPADARTENRRQTPIEPEIIDWRQQRELGLDQTRSMLAR